MYKPVTFICKNVLIYFYFFINSLMVYTRRHTLYQITNPLQFPHEPPRGSVLRNGWNAFVRVSLRLESRSWKPLEKQYLFAVRFQLIFYFFSQTRDCTTFTLQDSYIESVTAHCIKINVHSCFHNSWPNSKTKLKLKHLWEQGGPLVFRGPYAACIFCV